MEKTPDNYCFKCVSLFVALVIATCCFQILFHPRKQQPTYSLTERLVLNSITALVYFYVVSLNRLKSNLNVLK